MVYEIKLKSRKEFFDELKGLEVDTGVRVYGKLNGRRSVIFITKHSGKYALWIRDRRSGKTGSGSFKDVDDYEELSNFLEGTIEKPLRAFIY